MIRSAPNPLKPGEAAPDLKVVNSDGTTIDLAATWQTQPIVLTFLRHFG
jgi:peroxiredoxin